MDNNDRNKTKVAIVTGSSSGIGFDTSLLLARDGSSKSCVGNGTFELRDGTAESRTSRMAKRQSARALQQKIQPKRDIPYTASGTGYCK
jgi:NAD(P)-dependent dehydrogenase (short-subunit alcohol dehydrogenase family)